MSILYPTPKKYQLIDSTTYTLTPAVYTDKPEWSEAAALFSSLYERVCYSPLAIGEKGGVELYFDAAVAENAYRIESEGALKIYACAKEGLLYGLATALQMITAVNSTGKIVVEHLLVEDWPDKEYRAIMIEMGREWYSFDKLLKYVDLCFLYKIKYLNLHFMDHKLYTLPSKAFPKLNLPGRHYTEEQIAELNAYAAVRGIVLVPEFECPGHATPLTRAYPEIFANHGQGEGGEIYNESGEPIDHSSLVCAGSEVAVEAVKTLLAETAALFPNAPYIHIGGDEAPAECWNFCTACQTYMKEHNLADVGELYCDYVARIAKYVLSLGKTPIVWEGFPKSATHLIPKETVVIAWESHYQMPYELLEGGFRIINASWQPLYIVPSLERRWNYRDILNWNVYNWQHWWEHSKATLNPITVPPTDQLLGAMICVWEQGYDQSISYVIENLLALSERTWSVERVRTEREFMDGFAKMTFLAGKLLAD